MSQKAKRVHGKFWVFTWFHHLTTTPWDTLPEGITCIAWQEERCPTSKRLHLQGYVELARDRELSWLKKHVSQGACFRRKIRNSTRYQAYAYTQKEATRVQGPWCIGTAPNEGDKAGMRTDLVAFRDALFEGKSARSLWRTMPAMMARYPRMFASITALARPRRQTELEVYLIYGDTGSGKTHTVYADWEDNDEFWRWPVPNTAVWFDGYDRHELCLLDDFAGRSSKMSLVMLLQVLDKWPVLLPVKQSHCWWMPNKIALTTNIHPRDWYDWSKRKNQYMALKRRIHVVYDYTVMKEEDSEREDAGSEFWYDPVLFPRPVAVDLDAYVHVDKKARYDFGSDQEFFDDIFYT